MAACAGCNGRGDNGLEIMVWMNSGHSYVDAPIGPTGVPVANAPKDTNNLGWVQPSGWPREKVVINGVLYDVWTSRLNNPYFSASLTGPIVSENAEPYTCTSLPVNGGNGKTCGFEWNVVDFVATKDSKGTDYRQMGMTMDNKVFTDYILGIPNILYQVYSQPTAADRINGVLACPASAMDNQQADPPATYGTSPVTDVAPCLIPSWYLMSVQAGFETWFGGNGLQSDSFQAHVLTSSTTVQSGITSDTGLPVVNWQDPFEVVYSGCTSNAAGNSVTFQIEGTNISTGLADTYPSNNGWQAMAPVAGTNLFEFQVNAPGTPQLYPMHGNSTITFSPSCAGGTSTTITVFIDPSGHVYYSDGKTPVVGATVTLKHSASASGPFVAVPNHNFGLGNNPIMNPDDNTLNSMPSTQYGAYGWNVAPGYYQVNATKSGCGSVTSPVQNITTNPVTNLNIVLTCAAPPPLPPPSNGGNNGVTVQLTNNGTPWATGYCDNVVLTNTNSFPVTWKVNFTLPNSWPITSYYNFNYTRSGNVVTAWGVGYNNVLQPKQVSNSIGFCATN